VLMADWQLGTNRTLILLANLSDRAAELPAHFRSARPIWGGEPGRKIAPWAVFWSIGGP
jgi:hypothetical protein